MLYIIVNGLAVVYQHGFLTQRTDEHLLEVLIHFLAVMTIDGRMLRTELSPAGRTSLWQYLQFTGIQSIWRHSGSAHLLPALSFPVVLFININQDYLGGSIQTIYREWCQSSVNTLYFVKRLLRCCSRSYSNCRYEVGRWRLRFNDARRSCTNNVNTRNAR